MELDAPNGKNNGTIKGHRYFSCQQGFGSLVSLEKVTATTDTSAPGSVNQKPVLQFMGFDDDEDASDLDL